jgi:hypothetical protein
LFVKCGVLTEEYGFVRDGVCTVEIELEPVNEEDIGVY